MAEAHRYVDRLRRQCRQYLESYNRLVIVNSLGKKTIRRKDRGDYKEGLGEAKVKEKPLAMEVTPPTREELLNLNGTVRRRIYRSVVPRYLMISE